MSQNRITTLDSFGLCLIISLTTCGVVLPIPEVVADSAFTSNTGIMMPWVEQIKSVSIPTGASYQIGPDYCSFGTGSGLAMDALKSGASVPLQPIGSSRGASTDTSDNETIAAFRAGLDVDEIGRGIDASAASGSVKTNPEIIAAIRSSLSLNITEIAGVLNVERPTVYSWIQERSAPHQANQNRLATLYRIAREWDKLSSKPIGELLRLPNENGWSLLDLLRHEEIDEELIRPVLERLANDVESLPKRLAKGHGSLKGRSVRRSREDNLEFDVYTGKRTMVD